MAPPPLLPRDSHAEWLAERDWARVPVYWAAVNAGRASLPSSEGSEAWVDERVSPYGHESFQWTAAEERSRGSERQTFAITVGYQVQITGYHQDILRQR